MKQPLTCVLIIDRQEYWRTLAAGILRSAGYTVHVIDNYDFQQIIQNVRGGCVDLVILGCARVGPEEQHLTERLLHEKLRLIVLSSALPWSAMRDLFLEGAEDVADKPYDQKQLIAVVKKTLERLVANDSYQVVEREGIE